MMGYCACHRGGYTNDQHSANAPPISTADMAHLKAIMAEPDFEQAIGRYRVVNNQYNTPFLGGSNKAGDMIYQDARFARRVEAGDVKYDGRRGYDPRPFMNIHEAVEGYLIRHKKWEYPPAHHVANNAERVAVESQGGNWAKHTAAMRPEIELAEKETGQGTPPDLLVDPYKGSKYENHVKANERGPGSQNVSPNQPAPTMSAIGPTAPGGYAGGAPAGPDSGVQQSADEWPGGEVDKGAGGRKFILIRHGKTALNADDANQDKIRGWMDVPLDKTGKEEAKRLGRELANSGITFIAHSNMTRTKDTAEEIKKTTGAKMVSRPGLRPWNVGIFQGESSGKVHPELRALAENNPDQQIQDGESFTQFKCRVFSSLGETLEESDGEHTAIVTHHRDERLIHAWIAGGQREDLSIDFGVMFQPGEAPANADVVALDPDRVKLAAESACAELNKQGFQKYTHKAAGYHEDHGPPTPEHPEGTHCGVCRYYRGRDRCMIVVPPIGADDGCALFMPKGTKTGDGGNTGKVGPAAETGGKTGSKLQRDVTTGNHGKEGEMKVRNGKFGATNWDEREGPGGNVAGGSAMARTGGYDPELPSSAPGQLQSLMQSMTPQVNPGVSTSSPVFSIGGYKANYDIGAGGPPKAPKLGGGSMKTPHMGGGKVSVKAPSGRGAHLSIHHRALGPITQLHKSGYLTTQQHDEMVAQARKGIAAHHANMGSAKKVSAPPMSMTPPSAPGSAAGKSSGRGSTPAGVTAIPYPVTPYASGNGNGGGYGGLGSLAPNMQTQGPMGGNQQRMPWQQ